MTVMRLDVALVEHKLYTTRARAVAAIDAGLVSINGAVARKPSQTVGPDDRIDAGALPYSSGRGSLKLAQALDEFKIDPTGMTCLDIGASTGGFTEVLLSRGVSHVIAVEVGTDQMIPELKTDPRVLSLEKTDIRDLYPSDIINDTPACGHPSARGEPDLVPMKGIGLIVIDVSFISLDDIADAVAKWGAPCVIALIKPQFEVPAAIAKRANGIIKSEKDRQFAIDRAVTAFASVGYKNAGIIESPITGGSGNVEYLGLFLK